MIWNRRFRPLASASKPALDLPLNPRLEYNAEENTASRKPKKLLNSEELLFFCLHVLSGGVAGGIGLVQMEGLYGVSKGTLSNYFEHAEHAIYSTLKETYDTRIAWPSEEERRGIRGLMYGFPEAVVFCDGYKCSETSSGV